MGALDQLVWPLPARLAAVGFACALSAAAAGSIAYGFGFRYAASLGDTGLANLKTEHAEQARVAESANRLQLLQQVTRANETEALLLDVMSQHAEEKRQLQERISHVTTQYRPAPGAAAQPIPRCVFTAGWLRDYNAALGVPAPRPGAAATAAEQAAWPTPGTDAELLESGVTPADILAHAQDYGLWARTNLVQLNGLLDLQKKD
ncbi:lysis protein [Pseudomonas frederiksbergensis]|uniref:Lysis protein n=1 Tax=Pseudomonas frederiksbergensis TaxID=104087 RepID=A0A1J0EEX6_9PSED|nr:lysis protein [Pseudomonas frederiksbergensis]APC14543.1 lysis protein [Pseudomonas frederiksbergensis]